MSDSVRPHRRQPTRLPRPWDSPGKNTGVGCHCLLQCMKVKRESEVAQSFPTLCDPWTAAYQAPLSIGFSRQEYWVRCHFLLQGILLTQGLNPGLLHCRQMLYRLSHQKSPRSKRLLISWLQSPSAVILEPTKIKSATVSLFPHLFALKWWDRMPWS